jgi:hypothetical protein
MNVCHGLNVMMQKNLTMQATLRMMVTRVFGFFKTWRLGLGVKRPGVRLPRPEGERSIEHKLAAVESG